MRLIISPAKKMRVEEDVLAPVGLPVYLDEAEGLLAWMRGLDDRELQRLWRCNDEIARENVERVRTMDLRARLTPAVLAYVGIQYQYMAPSVFEEGQFDYVQRHLRILSGLYGVLRAMDGVAPYRLEMQAKATAAGARDLYAFWGDKILRAVTAPEAGAGEDRVIVNLASREYSRCVEEHLRPGDAFVTVVFGELRGGRVVQKGTYAKMARGEMVRFAAETGAVTPDDLRGFDRLGYSFDEARSTEATFFFVK